VQVGRPMQECYPATDENGEKTSWAGWHAVPNQLLYGPKGWCEAKEPQHRFGSLWRPSQMDGLTDGCSSFHDYDTRAAFGR